MNSTTAGMDSIECLDISLLENKVIPVTTQEGVRKVLNLPEVMEALGSGEIRSFDQLKSYQVFDVELFFAHLGVVAIDICGGSSITFSSDEWKSMLLKLGPDSSWRLIGDNVNEPAFMQPGIDEDRFLKKRKAKADWVNNPDEIGKLVLSKNHTVKNTSLNRPNAWHWIAALIELQTNTSYNGIGNYGTPRMNSGYSSRLKASAYVDMSASGKWKKDVAEILGLLPQIYQDYPHFIKQKNPISILWSNFWDGESQVPTTKLHPLYIDCNRLIRLFKTDEGSVHALTLSTKGTHVPTLDLKGNFGDPWAPRQIKSKGKDAGKTTSLSVTKVTQEIATNILTGSGGIIKSPLQDLPKDSGNQDAYLVIDVLPRDNDRTYGFTRKTIPIPSGSRSAFNNSDAAIKIDELSDAMMRLSKEAERIVYSITSKNHSKIIKKFNDELELVFYENLWDALNSQDLLLENWRNKLMKIAEGAVEFSIHLNSSGSQHLFKEEAVALSRLHKAWNKKIKHQ